MKARIWRQAAAGEWRDRQIDEGVVVLDAPRRRVSQPAGSSSESEALLTDEEGSELEPAVGARASHARCIVTRCVGDGGTPMWVLLCDDAVRVRCNGAELLLGLGVLHDRDEIVLQDGGAKDRFYFSTAQTGRVEPAPAGLSGNCPRCRTRITKGEPAVFCPSCAVWHHECGDRLPCWSAFERCGACHQQETAFSDQPLWSPAEL